MRFDKSIFTDLDQWQGHESLTQESWLELGRCLDNCWENDGSLSPLDLYCYLRARFGPPNGSFMAVRAPGTDNLFQWHYTVGYKGRAIHFLDRVERLEILVEAEGKARPEDWQILVSSLKGDYQRYGKAIGEVRRNLRRYTVFVNPFARVRQIVELAERRLGELPSGNLPKMPSIAEQGEPERLYEEMKGFLARFVEIRAWSFTLQALVPVWAESFVNMLFFLLGKPEVKGNSRLYEATLRLPIDIRISELWLKCRGFVEPVSDKAPEVKAFLTLMNDRNDLLHGNTDPKRLAFDQVFLDQVSFGSTNHEIPLFKDQKNLIERLVLGQSKGITVEDVLRRVAEARAFIDYVLSRLDHTVRRDVKVMMADSNPAIHDETRTLAILFPPEIPLGFPLVAKRSQER